MVFKLFWLVVANALPFLAKHLLRRRDTIMSARPSLFPLTSPRTPYTATTTLLHLGKIELAGLIIR